MTNSGKRRRSEKRAREQLKALYDVRSMPSDRIKTSRWGGLEWHQNNIGTAQIDEDILKLEQKLLITK